MDLGSLTRILVDLNFTKFHEAFYPETYTASFNRRWLDGFQQVTIVEYGGDWYWRVFQIGSRGTRASEEMKLGPVPRARYERQVRAFDRMLATERRST